MDPDTLRRWADEGHIRAYATPGGHRRFSRADLDRVAAQRRSARQPLALLGATPDRLTRAYARTYRADETRATIDHLEVGARDAFRAEGRRLVAVLLAYLDATQPVDRERWEAEAVELIGASGRRLAVAGASSVEAVTIFVRARQPLLAELGALGRRRALDPTRLAALFERAIGLFDRLLLQLVASHAEAVPPIDARRSLKESDG